MFSTDYPSSPIPSEADMDAMTAHVENRPYHEAFMREAIKMVRCEPLLETRLHNFHQIFSKLSYNKVADNMFRHLGRAGTRL